MLGGVNFYFVVSSFKCEVKISCRGLMPNSLIKLVFIVFKKTNVALGDLGVTCSLRDARFAGSYPAEVDGFFRT